MVCEPRRRQPTARRPTKTKRGPNDARRGIVWALFTGQHHHQGSTKANAGPRRPTAAKTANDGQHRSTKAHSSQRRPTKANAAQSRPTAPNDGQRRPTKAHSANDGQPRSTKAHSSQRWPTQAHEDKKGPKGTIAIDIFFWARVSRDGVCCSD